MALVGHSGAGKTTLVNLLPRFLRSHIRQEALVDWRRPLRQVDLNSWQQTAGPRAPRGGAFSQPQYTKHLLRQARGSRRGNIMRQRSLPMPSSSSWSCLKAIRRKSASGELSSLAARAAEDCHCPGYFAGSQDLDFRQKQPQLWITKRKLSCKRPSELHARPHYFHHCPRLSHNHAGRSDELFWKKGKIVKKKASTANCSRRMAFTKSCTRQALCAASIMEEVI